MADSENQQLSNTTQQVTWSGKKAYSLVGAATGAIVGGLVGGPAGAAGGAAAGATGGAIVGGLPGRKLVIKLVRLCAE